MVCGGVPTVSLSTAAGQTRDLPRRRVCTTPPLVTVRWRHGQSNVGLAGNVILLPMPNEESAFGAKRANSWSPPLSLQRPPQPLLIQGK
jgi:hypothetical protein